jgi:Tfp pilus assembly PilM family ATPase
LRETSTHDQMPESSNIIQMRSGRLQGLRRNLRQRKLRHITALDIDGPTLRISQAEVRGDRAVISGVLTAPLEISTEDRPDPALLGKAVRKALQSARINPGPVVMGVPRAQVILRTLSLPASNNLGELAAMVHLQIGKDLPFRKDDAVIDFRVRPQTLAAPTPAAETASAEPAALPKVEVLVAVAQREVVEFYKATAAAAGLKLAGLGLHSYANARCVQACGIAQAVEPVALVSLRPGEVIVDVISESSLAFSRGASVSPDKHEPPATVEPPTPPAEEAAPVPEPLNFVDAATIEVVRSLHSYNGMDPANVVTKAVVTGATGQEDAVVEALQKRLTFPVSLLDVAVCLKLSGSDRDKVSGAMSSIGLALGIGDPQGLPFDFLHPKRPPVQRDMGRIRVIAGAAAAVLMIFAIIALRSQLINKRLLAQKQVQSELTAAQKMQPLYRQVRGQHAAVEEWIGEGKNWLDHYIYLSSVLPGPEEIYVTSLSVSGQGTIRMSVQAKSGEILARLDKQLRAAGYDVKPQAITPGNDKFGYDFRSSVELIIPPKMKMDISKAKPPGRPSDDVSLEGGKPTARSGRANGNVLVAGGAQ